MFYEDLESQVLITTSHDLGIKVFDVSNDEFKLSLNRYKPIPFGIKYYILDPFGTDERGHYIMSIITLERILRMSLWIWIKKMKHTNKNYFKR